METLDAIKARRNVRVYQDRPVSPGDLDWILEAGRRSPSSTNEQPWDFVLVTDRDRLRELAGVWHHGGHVASSAATVVLVRPISSDPDERAFTAYDHGQASMSMMIAAADLGIGSCHSAVGDQALARKILGLPEDRECVILIAFGYPADRPLAPIERHRRRPFAEVVHREAW